MTTDHDRDTDASTDTTSDDPEASGSRDAQSAPVSRRGVLGVLAGLGLLGAASRPASAQSTTLEFGGNYTGDPGSNFGLRLAPDNARFGMLGVSETTDGRGLVGRATAASGNTIGVLGRADSPQGVGMQGQNDATSGPAFGGFFRTFSRNGRGFLGIAEAASGDTFGAIGKSRSTAGTGVEGNATAGSGTTYGVAGRANSPDGYGLYTPDDARVEGTLEFTEGGGIGGPEVEIQAGGERVVRLDFTGEEVNVVNGFRENRTGADTQGAVIGGGGSRDLGMSPVLVPNEVFDDFGTVGGGRGNRVGIDDGNPGTATAATIAGGDRNTATAASATVAGGRFNDASGPRSSIGGGSMNTVSAAGATVPGGGENTADGAYSFAAGRSADTNGNDGAFVLGDSSTDPIAAQNPDEVRSQMPIYAPSFNTTSTRSAKTDVTSVDPGSILDRVESLSVSTWAFEHGDEGRHMGPMAGDFHDAFGLGNDEGTIATVDADGVALAAIQGLADRLDERTERIVELERENGELREAVDDVEEENERLRERVEALEDAITGLPTDAAPPSGSDSD